MRKITLILMSLCLFIGAASAQTVVTDLNQLSNEKKYFIKSKRCFLTCSDAYSVQGKLCTNNGSQVGDVAEDYVNDTKQQFQIVNHNGKYYLYSVYKGMYIKKDSRSINNDDITTKYGVFTSTMDEALSFEYVSGKGEYCWKLKLGDYYMNSQEAGQTATGIIIDGWSTTDDGNSYRIIEIEEKETLGFDKEQFDSYMDLSTDYLEASAKNTVGYPVVESDEFIVLNTVHNDIFVNKGYSNKETYEYNQEDYDAIVDAYNNYIACSNVALPQNGRAYKIVNVQNAYNDNNEYYLECGENGTLSFALAEYANDVFVCRVINDNFVFVNRYGKYLTLTGQAQGEYSGDANVAVSRLSVEGVDCNSTFTYFSISGYSNGFLYYLLAQSNGEIGRNMSTNAFSNKRSGAFKFIEVEYPNNVKLNAYSENDLISDIPGATIGTFSAPFPTVIPNDVTAYYASSVGERVNLMKVEGADAIPANQGVILIGATGDVKNALMIPAANEERASISEANNFFAHTAGETKTMNENGTDYILTKADGVIGFYPAKGTLGMNKAYLANVSDGFSAVRMVVDETTAIEGVAAEKVDAPIYDLTGRRVLNTAKGGVYIQNGKKFIVK